MSQVSSALMVMVKQVAQLWQRDHVSMVILKMWVTLRLNFRLKGYVLRQYLSNVKIGEW